MDTIHRHGNSCRISAGKKKNEVDLRLCRGRPARGGSQPDRKLEPARLRRPDRNHSGKENRHILSFRTEYRQPAGADRTESIHRMECGFVFGSGDGSADFFSANVLTDGIGAAAGVMDQRMQYEAADEKQQQKNCNGLLYDFPHEKTPVLIIFRNIVRFHHKSRVFREKKLFPLERMTNPV